MKELIPGLVQPFFNGADAYGTIQVHFLAPILYRADLPGKNSTGFLQALTTAFFTGQPDQIIFQSAFPNNTCQLLSITGLLSIIIQPMHPNVPGTPVALIIFRPCIMWNLVCGGAGRWSTYIGVKVGRYAPLANTTKCNI